MGKKLFVIILSIMMFFLPAQATYALTTTELYNNAVNNIFFYSNTEDECDPEDMSGYVATATGDRMTWIGDNFSYTAQKVIREVYPGVSLFAEAGRSFSESGAAESGIDLVKRLAGANSLRKFVVFMLGLNGGDNKSEQESKDMINTLISAVGDDKTIVLMTPYTRSRKYENFRNAVEATAKSNKNVLVADWAKAVQDDIDTYFDEGMDSINNTGYNMLVRVVKKALDDYTDSTKKKASSTVGASLGSGNQGASDGADGTDVLTSASMNERAIYIAQRLRGAGYDGDAIAGILGNLRAESSLNPSIMEKKGNYGGNVEASWRISGWSGYGKVGFGIAQWTSKSRQDGLQKFADENGLQVTSLEAQTGFLIKELQARDSVKVSTLNGKGIEYATFQVFRHYEVPGASFWTTHNGKHYNDYDPTTLDKLSESKTPSAYKAYNKRLNYAKDFLKTIEANGIAQGSGIVWEGGNPTEGGVSNGAICPTEANGSSMGSAKGSADLAKLARAMSWPDDNGKCQSSSGSIFTWKSGGYKACYSNPRDKYKEALTTLKAQGVKGVKNFKYMDCSYFIATLVKYSGLDINWPGGSSEAYRYVKSASGQKLWKEIENIGNTSNLKPGDIFSYPRGTSSGHVMIYIGEYGGKYGNMAGASLNDHVAILGKIYFNHKNNGSGAGTKFRISRYIGGATVNSGTTDNG